MGAVTVRTLAPLAHVTSVPASIEFYRKLGFEVGNTFTPQGAPEPQWASLNSNGGAWLMIGKAGHPIDTARQNVFFYLYVDVVARSSIPTGTCWRSRTRDHGAKPTARNAFTTS